MTLFKSSTLGVDRRSGRSHFVARALMGAGLILLGVAGHGGVSSPALAKRAVPDSVKVACSGDYQRFCGKYQVGTSSLDQCMRSNGKRLSTVCVRELVDKGSYGRKLVTAGIGKAAYRGVA